MTRRFGSFIVVAVSVLLQFGTVSAQAHGAGGAWVKEETRDKWGDVVGFRYVQTVTASGSKGIENTIIHRTLKIICDSEGDAALVVSPNYDIYSLSIPISVSLRDANGVVRNLTFRNDGTCYGGYCNEFIGILTKDGEYRIALQGMYANTRWSLNATISGALPTDVNDKRDKREGERKQEEEAKRIAMEQIVGVWVGSYIAGQGETGLTLNVYQEGTAHKATFDFYNLPGKTNAATGKYNMNVSYNPSTKRYVLVGYKWIERPSNYGFANLEGTISGGVFSGNIIGSSYTFKVVKGTPAVSVFIATHPPNADVYINGQLIGKANAVLQVPVGTHRVKFVKDNLEKTETRTFHAGSNPSWLVPLK